MVNFSRNYIRRLNQHPTYTNNNVLNMVQEVRPLLSVGLRESLYLSEEKGIFENQVRNLPVPF